MDYNKYDNIEQVLETIGEEVKGLSKDEFNDEEESFCYFKENFYFYNMYYHEKLMKNIYKIESPENNSSLSIFFLLFTKFL